MLNLSQIQQAYPPQLHPFKPFLLREYLQYKILALLFSSEYALKFVFLGGTCLRNDIQRIHLFGQFVQQTPF